MKIKVCFIQSDIPVFNLFQIKVILDEVSPILRCDNISFSFEPSVLRYCNQGGFSAWKAFSLPLSYLRRYQSLLAKLAPPFLLPLFDFLHPSFL